MRRLIVALAMLASLALPTMAAGPVLAAPVDPVRYVGIDAYGDSGLRVSGLQPGERVTVRTKGAAARTAAASKSGTAWFGKLTAGRKYAISLAGRTIGYGFPARASLDVRPTLPGQLKVISTTEGPAYLRLAGTPSGRARVSTARQAAIDAAGRLVRARSTKAGTLAIAEATAALEDANNALDAAITAAGTQPVATPLPATPAAIKKALASRSLVRASAASTLDLEPGTSWVPASSPDGAATGSTVIVLDAVGEPWAASARLGADIGSVRLTWAHVRVPWTGEVIYRVTATPADGDGSTVKVDVPITGSGARADVTLVGLDENESGYLLAIQARNAVSASGRLWRTTLSLAAARAAGGGEVGLLDVTDGTPLPEPPPAPAAPTTNTGGNPGGSSSVVPVAPPSGGGFNRQPQPYTYTIETQPYTFTTQSQPYTFHQESTPYTYGVTTEHRAYTYHDVFVQTGPTVFVPTASDWSGTVCYGGTLYAQGCGYFSTPGYNQPTLDATPNGWTDTGSDWTRQVVTKNPTPSGWTDDGAQWTRQVKNATPTGWTDDSAQWTRQVKAPCPTGYVDDGTQCAPA